MVLEVELVPFWCIDGYRFKLTISRAPTSVHELIHQLCSYKVLKKELLLP